VTATVADPRFDGGVPPTPVPYRSAEKDICRGRSLSVALVSTERRWHGGEEQAALLARGLRARGHRVVVLARANAPFIQRMADGGFEVHPFLGNGRNPAAFCQIRAALHRLRPDVLQYNDPHAITAAGLASLGLPIGARVATRRVCFPIRWTFRYRTFCDRVLCVSHAVERVCRESGLAAKTLRVVHDGLATDAMQPGDRARTRAALAADDAEALLLTVAQFAPCKGHVHLFEAFRNVARLHPESRLLLAGDGPLRAELETQAHRLGIDGRVRFLGYRRDVPDLLAAADLFVLPSLNEAMSVALMEAMLARCPVVTTTAGGICDVTGDPKRDGPPAAWTVPPGDPEALGAAILEALSHPRLRADRAQCAHRRVLDRFTDDHMVDSTLAVYGELLAKRLG